MAAWESPTAPYRPPRDNQQTTSDWHLSWDNNDTYSTTTTYYSNVSTGNVAVITFPAITHDAEHLFEKGKFFKFESSMEFRAWFGKPKLPKKAFKARHGFQQMCRIPCYRGVRTR